MKLTSTGVAWSLVAASLIGIGGCAVDDSTELGESEAEICNPGEAAPVFLSLALFLLGMAGLGVSMWPYVVPEALTIWQAAAPERSQAFMLVGVAITLPLILGYTGWAYWVFRGKVSGEGYHH